MTKNFTFVFTDSWSQTIPNYYDSDQQKHWKVETQKLWDIMTSLETPFGFKTREDILEENKEMKEKIKWLEEHERQKGME